MIAQGVAFDDIAEAHLLSLIESGIGERRTIEYKSELPGGKDDDRREFLADVSSLANAVGGDLLFGVLDDAGIPKQLVPLEFEPDGERLKWENVIRDGLQPRVPGVRVREISVDGGFALLFRIPQSWSAPHAVTYKGSRSLRFYTRNSSGKYPLDVAELRDAFLASSSVGDRIRNFRMERLAKIAANDVPIRLGRGPTLVAHLVPYRRPADASPLELNSILGSGLFRPGFGNLYSTEERWNLDGLLAISHREHGDAYGQLFRDGTIELVDSWSLRRETEPGKQPWIYGIDAEVFIVTGLGNPLAVVNRPGVDSPVAIMVSLLGVGQHLFETDRGFRASHLEFDRDAVLLPEVIVDDVSAVEPYAVPTLLRPIVDALWQAAGAPRSPHYTAEGAWIQPRG